MPERRLMRIVVSLELLRDVLGLPESTTIMRVETPHQVMPIPDWAELVIEDKSFEPVRPGCHLRTTEAMFQHHRSLHQFVGWSHEKEKGATNA